MLSWSIEETNAQIDLLPIATGEGDPLVPGGPELIAYVNATLSGENTTLSGHDVAPARRAVVTALGPEAAVDAAAVIGNFEMMNRIADGVGMPVGPGTRKIMADVINDLELDRFPHA
jgi:hypothetical protein